MKIWHAARALCHATTSANLFSGRFFIFASHLPDVGIRSYRTNGVDCDIPFRKRCHDQMYRFLVMNIQKLQYIIPFLGRIGVGSVLNLAERH